MRKYVLAIALSMAAITLSPSAFAVEGGAQAGTWQVAKDAIISKLNGPHNSNEALLNDINAEASRFGEHFDSLDQVYAFVEKGQTQHSPTTTVSLADFKADQARQDKDIHDTYVLANTKYTEAAGKALEATVASNKADQAKTDALQDHRIDNNDAKIGVVQGEVQQNRSDLATESNTRADADKLLQRGIDNNSSKIGVVQGKVQDNRQAIKTETSERKDADDKLSQRIDTKVGQSAYDADKATQSAIDAGQNGAISTAQTTAESAQQVATSNTGLIQKEVSDRKDGDARLKTSIDTNSSLIATKADNTEMQQKFADTSNRIAETKAAQAKTDKVVADHSRTLANHESRIQDLEANTSANFKDLKRQIDDNKKSADAGIAGVAAMAAIPQVLESQTFNVGAGVGSRSDQEALAVGFSARASQSTVIKVAVAADTNSQWTAGAGIAVGW